MSVVLESMPETITYIKNPFRKMRNNTINNLNKVDFPQPVGPVKRTKSPRSIAKLKSKELEFYNWGK